MVKNASVLVLCAFLPAACHRPVQPPSEPPKALNVQAPATQRGSVSLLGHESRSVASSKPQPELTPMPESIPVDVTPSDMLRAKQEWESAKQGQYEIALASEARRLGFDQVKWSVSETVDETIREARPISELRRTLLIAAGDKSLTVSQVLGKGKALVLNSDGSVAYLVKAPAAQLYEGTPIDQISPAWRVLGTTSYTSFRGVKQAFLLEPQPAIDVEAQEWALAMAPLVRADGSVSVVNMVNDVLRECTDAASLDRIEQSPRHTHLIGLRRPCAEAFTRPPATTCTVPGKAKVFGYALQLPEQECTKAGGAWSTTIAPSTDE